MDGPSTVALFEMDLAVVWMLLTVMAAFVS
jgi:hypothetical protein